VKQTATAPAFAGVLQAEHDALAAFLSLLQAEQEILVHGDADRLAQLAPDKARQIEELSRLGHERNRYLEGQGLGANSQGIKTWLETQSITLRRTWRELLRRAQAAQQLNKSNGLLIESRLQQNRMKLSVLQAAASPGGLYRADGQISLLHRARALGQV